jgi:hypothetical protein
MFLNCRQRAVFESAVKAQARQNAENIKQVMIKPAGSDDETKEPAKDISHSSGIKKIKK